MFTINKIDSVTHSEKDPAVAPASQTHFVSDENVASTQPIQSIQVKNSTQRVSKSQKSLESLKSGIEANNDTNKDPQSQHIPVYAVPHKKV